jgi:hypothetical protein
VQGIVPRCELRGEPVQVGAGREISGQYLYPLGTHFGRDAPAQRFSAFVVPAGDDDVSAGASEFGRDDPAHPAGASGDECGAAV